MFDRFSMFKLSVAFTKKKVFKLEYYIIYHTSWSPPKCKIYFNTENYIHIFARVLWLFFFSGAWTNCLYDRTLISERGDSGSHIRFRLFWSICSPGILVKSRSIYIHLDLSKSPFTTDVREKYGEEKLKFRRFTFPQIGITFPQEKSYVSANIHYVSANCPIKNPIFDRSPATNFSYVSIAKSSLSFSFFLVAAVYVMFLFLCTTLFVF
jgi:hypothetical protein